jgi:phytoene/squalene synthetase
MGIRMFDDKFRQPIYNIYGFVRLADEIVDTMHGYPKEQLLEEFKIDTYRAIDRGISTNPILQAFQEIVRKYDINTDHIDAFLESMEMDLEERAYDKPTYDHYIYGSAEVVGLMCLKIFCEGDKELYDKLEPHAKSLGSAFQKVNFLRDMKADYLERGRVYFPGVDFEHFTDEDKHNIEQEILGEFEHAYEGIIQLPIGARIGVYVAYIYYRKLFNKISTCTAELVKEKRIRISNSRKVYLLCSGIVQLKLRSY